MSSIIVTQIFDCELQKVWNALSNEQELKKWYFPVQNYQFEEGKIFSFYESCESSQYFHQCQFLKIIPNKTIEYTWTHPNDSKGSSILNWTLEDWEGKTQVTLSHTGVENFADAGASFSKENFEMGWNAIVKTTLRNYLYGIEQLKFEIEINTTPEQLWQALFSKENYSIWTSPFCEGSYYNGEMKQGSRIHFMAPSGEGMYSDVAFCKENELMVFRHIGMIKNNVELPLDDDMKRWTGCFETYRLILKDNKTLLKVEVDAVEAYANFLQKAFPQALQILKTKFEN